MGMRDEKGAEAILRASGRVVEHKVLYLLSAMGRCLAAGLLCSLHWFGPEIMSIPGLHAEGDTGGLPHHCPQSQTARNAHPRGA